MKRNRLSEGKVQVPLLIKFYYIIRSRISEELKSPSGRSLNPVLYFSCSLVQKQQMLKMKMNLKQLLTQPVNIAPASATVLAHSLRIIDSFERSFF
jgi:hypothetical protein